MALRNPHGHFFASVAAIPSQVILTALIGSGLLIAGCSDSNESAQVSSESSSAPDGADVTMSDPAMMSSPGMQDPSTDPAMADPAAPATAAPGTDPAALATADPGTDPAALATADPGTDPAALATADPGTDPAALATAAPGTDPAAPATIDPATDPAALATADPGTDPAAPATIDPATDSAARAAAQPGTLPGAEPNAAPGALPGTEGAGAPGDPGFAGGSPEGGTSQAKEPPADSPDYPAFKLVMGLMQGKHDGLKDHVSTRGRGLIEKIRSGSLTAEEKADLKKTFAQPQLVGNPRTIRGSRTVTLNSAGQVITLVSKKQGSDWKVNSISIKAAKKR